METALLFLAGLIGRLFFVVSFLVILAVPVGLVLYFAVGMKRLVALASPVREAGSVKWHRGLAYTPGHAWLTPQGDRGVLLGLDDVARRLLAGAASIIVPPVGTELRPGAALATVRVGDRTAVIPSPVAGTVIESHEALASDTKPFELDPFRAGWLLRVQPASSATDAKSGREAFEWMKGEARRLDAFLETRLGYASADGGTLTGPPAHLLSNEAFAEAAKTFLQAA